MATFNIHHGVGADGRLDLARTADAIAATDATLVGLQEVDRTLRPAATGSTRRRGWASASAWTSSTAPRSTATLRTRPCRRAPPALRQRTAVRPPRAFVAGTAAAGAARREARGLLDARVDVDGTTVRVLVTHLQNRSGRERQEQAAHIVDLLAGDGERPAPTVLLGDMNAGPDAPEMRVLTAVLTDAWAAVGDGPGHTFAARRPFARIDHVLVSSGLTPVAAEVADTRASDHRPVVAELDLVGARPGP